MKKIILIVLAIGILVLVLQKFEPQKPEVKTEAVITPTPTIIEIPKFVYPVAQFRERITKKFFGTKVSDRFSGYHTGVDVEYEDVSLDVPVFAIADGEVVVSKWTSGYGGLVIIKHNNVYGIYGHLRPASMVTGKVTTGQQIGLLGTGKSNETDGERRHLHFGLANSPTVLGYVQNQKDLSGWLDPLQFLGVN